MERIMQDLNCSDTYVEMMHFEECITMKEGVSERRKTMLLLASAAFFFFAVDYFLFRICVR
jgi:hypothetical protein